ncbi:MAG: hypothetical protein NTX03_05760 [Bacteroidetes bacterium]|nr:hypothetical protein [Bacteroidota bacterium]
MAFVREQGNVIDYEIPITGNLKDPKFDLWDVIIDVLTNIFVKPVTIPYRIHVKNTESEIEKSLTLKWEMLGSELVANQKHFIKKMSRFLLRNPDASIAVSPQHYTAKEKEYILFFEAKKKYYLVRNHKNEQQFTDSDSICVARMSVKDSVFLNYVSKQIKGAMLFTVQEKCAAFTNPNIINARLEKLNRERAIAFMLYFKKMGVDKQLKFSVAQNVIPYNGYSFYKIDYNGEYPEALLIAYSKMNGLNNMPPRKEFKVERQKTGIFGKK